MVIAVEPSLSTANYLAPISTFSLPPARQPFHHCSSSLFAVSVRVVISAPYQSCERPPFTGQECFLCLIITLHPSLTTCVIHVVQNCTRGRGFLSLYNPVYRTPLELGSVSTQRFFLKRYSGKVPVVALVVAKRLLTTCLDAQGSFI